MNAPAAAPLGASARTAASYVTSGCCPLGQPRLVMRSGSVITSLAYTTAASSSPAPSLVARARTLGSSVSGAGSICYAGQPDSSMCTAGHLRRAQPDQQLGPGQVGERIDVGRVSGGHGEHQRVERHGDRLAVDADFVADRAYMARVRRDKDIGWRTGEHLLAQRRTTRARDMYPRRRDAAARSSQQSPR